LRIPSVVNQVVVAGSGDNGFISTVIGFDRMRRTSHADSIR
jgi:hypothetical protein